MRVEALYNGFVSLYLGCPIWSFKGWVGNFYPKGTKPADFLLEYARRLNTVEGNTTFYAVPAAKTIEGWAAALPDTFRFCAKVPKAISHEGTLASQVERAVAFVDVMRGLGDRLGPMFLQLPPRYSPKLLDDLRHFLSQWPRDVRLAVEVRHMDWFEPPHDSVLDELLAERHMARVTIDTRPIRDLRGDAALAGSTYDSLLEARERKPDMPVVPKRTADFVFVRYIGHPQLSVNAPLLDEWGNYFAEQINDGAHVFMFCHSPDNLVAPYLCREVHARVAAKAQVNALPWDSLEPPDPEQGKLF